MILIRGLLRLTVVLLALTSCGTSTRLGPAARDVTLPTTVDRLVERLGAPPIRFTVDVPLTARLLPDQSLLGELPDDVRGLVERVEFLGYYAGPDSIARFSVMNDVVVSRRIAVLPELTVAEPGELPSTGRAEAPGVGQTSAELVELSGIPDEYQRSEEREVLTYSKGDDYMIAFAEAKQVWSIFTLRIASDLEPNYRSDLATMIMAVFIDTGKGFDLGRNREHVIHMLRAGRK